MLTGLFLIIGLLVLFFGGTLLFGAPYLPTLKRQIDEALDLLELQKGDTLLEIGSGDGRVLLAAAERGYRGIGYEINPILVIISRWRLRRYRGGVQVIWANALSADWPPAQGIYIFGITKIMPQLYTKIIQYTCRPLNVVSFGFPFPNQKPTRQKLGLFMYRFL